jgi:hypothetical protein
MRQTSFEATGCEDKYVNGYSGNGKVPTKNPKKIALLNAIDRYLNEYSEQDIVSKNVIDDIATNYLDLVDNTDKGYKQREEFFEKYLKTGETFPESNEAGYINEYWWYHNNGRGAEWHPWDRYLTNREFMYQKQGYYAKLDYNSPSLSVEIKTLKYYDVNGKKHPYPRFVIPKVKIGDFKSSGSTANQIVYVLCKSYNEIIDGRQSQTGFWVTYNMANWDDDLSNGNICPISRTSSKQGQKSQESFVIRYNCMLLNNPELEEFYGKPAMDEDSKSYEDECKDIQIHSIQKDVNPDFLPDTEEEEKKEEEEVVVDKNELPFVLSDNETRDFDLLTQEEKIDYIESRKQFPNDSHKWTLIGVLQSSNPKIKNTPAVNRELDEREKNRGNTRKARNQQ